MDNLLHVELLQIYVFIHDLLTCAIDNRRKLNIVDHLELIAIAFV